MPPGWPIAVYFFSTGSLAGLYITSVIATLLKKEEWKPVAKIGALDSASSKAESYALLQLLTTGEFAIRFQYASAALVIIVIGGQSVRLS